MRLIFFAILIFISNQLMSAATVLVEVIHQKNVKVRLRDAALTDYLVYDPIFDFPDKTTFGLDDGSFTLLEVTVSRDIYYLYLKGSFITIDLIDSKIKSDAFFLFKKKKDFFNTNVNGKWLLHLFDIELFYHQYIHSIDSLLNVDNSYGQIKNGERFWDKRSAKKLLNFLDKKYTTEQDFQLKYHSPSYIEYTSILYQLAYQFNGKELLNTLSIEKQFEEVQSKIAPSLKDAVLLHHFFRPSVPFSIMEGAFAAQYMGQLDQRIYSTAKAVLSRSKNKKDLNSKPEVDWIFGLDVDEALSSFFQKQELKKPSIVIFWTTFGSAMDYEYYHLRELYAQYGSRFNFIFVCVNAFEQEQKAKAIVLREKLNGHHLFTKNADAFWKSEWKNKRINTLPFYMIIDDREAILETIDIPLDYASLLKASIESYLNE